MFKSKGHPSMDNTDNTRVRETSSAESSSAGTIQVHLGQDRAGSRCVSWDLNQFIPNGLRGLMISLYKNISYK